VHLEVDRENPAALKLYRRAGFTPRDNYIFMSRKL
jgi:ribosomal protein S18 acetylase RimI-like enzyme